MYAATARVDKLPNMADKSARKKVKLSFFTLNMRLLDSFMGFTAEESDYIKKTLIRLMSDESSGTLVSANLTYKQFNCRITRDKSDKTIFYVKRAGANYCSPFRLQINKV